MGVKKDSSYRLQKIVEITTWVVIASAIVFVYMHPDVSINKLVIYTLAIFTGGMLSLVNLISRKFYIPKLSRITEIFLIICIAILIYLSKSLSDLFFFIYFLPIIASAIDDELLDVSVISMGIGVVILADFLFKFDFSTIPFIYLLFKIWFLFLIPVFVHYINKDIISKKDMEKEKVQKELLELKKEKGLLKNLLSALGSESFAIKTKQEKAKLETKKAIRLNYFVLLPIHVIILLFVAFLYYFSNLDLTQITFLKIILIISVVFSSLYPIIIIPSLLKKRPETTVRINIFVLFLILVISGQILGLTNPISVILVVVAIFGVAFLVNPQVSLTVLLFEFCLIAIRIFIDPEEVNPLLDNSNILIFETILISLITASGYILAQKYHNEKTQSKKSMDLFNKLMVDKIKVEAIMQSMGDGVFVVDTKKNIVLINKAAVSLLDLVEEKSDSLLGKFYGDTFKLKVEDKFLSYEIDCPVQKAISENNSSLRDDLTLITGRGKEIKISLFTSPVRGMRDDIIGGVGVIRDITKEKEIERMKYEFISIASHELSTPITALEGYLSLVLDKKTGTLSLQKKSFINDAYKISSRLSKLVKDLLDVSKIEEGKMPFTLKTFDLTELTEQIVSDLSFKAEKKKVKLEYKKLKEPIFVNSDPDRISEVATNLINNAIKFTPQGKVVVEHEVGQKYITTSITDTGIGIAKEYVPYLFQKFHQVDSKYKKEGSGLGLYICKSIIQKSGGQIKVESALGKGSKFSFILPRVINKREDKK